MAGKSDYLEDALINHILRNSAYTSPTTVYVGLYTAAPSDAGGGTEVSGTNYARQSIAFDAPSPAGETQNTSIVTFPVAGAGGWGTVTHFGIFDAVSAGNLLYWAALDASKAIAENDQANYPIGSLEVDED